MGPNTSPIQNVFPKRPQNMPGNNEYGHILLNCGIPYVEENQWLYAGEKLDNPNIFFYISVCVSQATTVFHIVFPVLKRLHIKKFRLIRNAFYHYQINGGHFGSEEIGKALTIWPDSKEQTELLLNELGPRLASFKGPSIMENCYRMGEVFYFATGANRKSCFIHSLNIEYSIEYLQYPQKIRTIGKYIPVKMLKYSPKGNVYKGYSIKNLSFCPCLIKEGRAGMAEDGANRDVKQRLAWEKKVLQEIYYSVPVPAVKGYLEQRENGYLILEWLEGCPLGDTVKNLRKDKNFKSLPGGDKKKILEFLLMAVTSIEKLHESGYVHRDLNENNFIVSRSGDIYIIDFEIAYNINNHQPAPAFFYGMPGFAAPEQSRHATPTFKEDVYSTGVLIACLLTDLKAIDIEAIERGKLKNIINHQMEDNSLGNILVRCLDNAPKRRPEINELEKTLKAFII